MNQTQENRYLQDITKIRKALERIVNILDKGIKIRNEQSRQTPHEPGSDERAENLQSDQGTA